MKERAGVWKNNLTGEAAYKSFSPASLPPKPPIELDNSLVSMLVEANKMLTTLNSYAKLIPNVNLFISMYLIKESLMSSQIEGTQATLEDILDPTIDKNANRDVSDVINYVKATEFALERLNEFPLCNRLIKETHAKLIKGIRGNEKNPGEFRTSQNWIGGQGSSIKTARFIPPNKDDMEEAMSDLEKYMNTDDDSDVLIRAALIHYQFETIHPFLDGNGRIGRLLITLFLMENGILKSPALYISYFLKKNRIEYYDRMTEVRRTGNFEQWIKFFLEAIYVSAENAILTIDNLTALHNRNIETVSKLNSEAAKMLFTFLEQTPIIEIGKTADELGISYNTAYAAVKKLCDAGILKQTNKKRRRRIFSYTEYLDILKNGTELL
jgi:Fic family protein